MKIKKNEKGEIALNDYMLAISIFVLGTYLVTFMYQQIYKLTAKTKVDEAVIGYVTEICEQIDLKNYEDVSTVEGVESLINETLNNSSIKDNVEITCMDVEKYSDKTNLTNVKDYVERIHLKITYISVNNSQRNYYINKIKVKEL